MDQHTPEIEAAEALAALAHCSTAAASFSEEPTRLLSEDQAVAASHENKYAMATIASTSAVTYRDAPTKLGSNRCNSATKLRRNLTEAEKEARKLRRILANRESARETVRRRQATLMELTRKEADLLVENENLKKEKELAVEAYNSLKIRNEFLKLQVANAKKAESQEPKSSQAEKPTAATTSSPLSLYNQPYPIPFLWPSFLSSNAIHYQYPFHSDVISLSESSLQRRDISSSHQGPEISLGRTGQGNSLFGFPLPWVLPFPSYGPMLYPCSNTEKRENKTPSTHQRSIPSSSDAHFVIENNELSPKSDMLLKACSCIDSTPIGSDIGAHLTYPVNSGDHCIGLHSEVTLTRENSSCIRPTRNCSEGDTSDPYAASATDNVLETLPKNNAELVIRDQKNPKSVFSAIIARRRRKELMKLRNVKSHNCRTPSANSWVYAK